jgi:hypothetical protein
MINPRHEQHFAKVIWCSDLTDTTKHLLQNIIGQHDARIGTRQTEMFPYV